MLSALGKVAWSPYSRMVLKNSSTRGYCSTSVVLARKGSSAFIEKPRDFSKKQKKRFKKRMFLKVENEKRNNSLGGAANDLISRQLELPETQELIETTGDRYVYKFYSLCMEVACVFTCSCITPQLSFIHLHKPL